MARTIITRSRIWDRLSEAQRKRYIRYGITPSYYESGGLLQRARGHLPREHITRRERNPEGFTSTDYWFISKQAARNNLSLEEFGPFIRFYRSLSLSNRQLMRKRVHDENRAYKARGFTKLRKLDLYMIELRNNYPWFKEGMHALMFYH